MSVRRNQVKMGIALLNGDAQEGDLAVWHIPQVPMRPFQVSVATPQEGKRVMAILAEYDLFQLANNIKPDYANANGLNVYEGGEWVTWYDEDGNDIDDLEIDENGDLVLREE